MENPREYDPYALPKDAVQEPPHALGKALRQIGPGLILAASIVGTGELINTTSLGARAGFSLLWLILLSCVIKVFVQVELGRYAITQGKTSLAAFNSLPGPRLGASWLCWCWLFMCLATQAQIAAMEGTVGQAAHMAFPDATAAMTRWAGLISPGWSEYLATREEHVWATLTTIAAVALLLSGGYKRLEHITTFLIARSAALLSIASQPASR
jgi:Mn2+/Fe2+ NRAMP family transporter